MRKSALLGLGASALMAGGFFVPALAGTGTQMFNTPCGSSAEAPGATGNSPGSPVPNVDTPSSSGTGAVGIWGSNGYLEANGSASSASGGISGDLYNAGTDEVYGGISGSATGGSGNVCVGTAATGAQNVALP